MKLVTQGGGDHDQRRVRDREKGPFLSGRAGVSGPTVRVGRDLCSSRDLQTFAIREFSAGRSTIGEKMKKKPHKVRLFPY